MAWDPSEDLSSGMYNIEAQGSPYHYKHKIHTEEVLVNPSIDIILSSLLPLCGRTISGDHMHLIHWANAKPQVTTSALYNYIRRS